MIDQLHLKDFTGFENPAGEPQIGFRRGGIAAGVIVHHDESEGAEGDDRFEDFPRVSQGFVERSLAYGNHLDELLLGVNKHNAQRFVTKKAHFGAEFRYRHGRVDQEPRAFLAQGDRGQAEGADQLRGLVAWKKRQEVLNGSPSQIGNRTEVLQQSGSFLLVFNDQPQVFHRVERF